MMDGRNENLPLAGSVPVDGPWHTVALREIFHTVSNIRQPETKRHT